MFFHPSTILFFTSLTFSVILTISTNSWFMLWVGMELNIMSFIPLILQKTNKYSVESALKYFLTQAMSSALIIFFVVLNFSLTFYMLLISIMLKMGAAPLHLWVPNITQSMPWGVLLMLLSVQKIPPLVLALYMTNYFYPVTLLSFFISLSALMGAIGGLSQTSLRSILVFSSITHISWLLSAILVSNWAWASYFLIYMMILSSLTPLLSECAVNTLNQLFVKPSTLETIMISVTFLSLSGFPPFTGFLPKLVVVQLLTQSELSFIIFPLLTSTFINLFFYSRIFTSGLMLSAPSNSPMFNFKPTTLLFSMNLVGLLAIPIFMV